MVQLLFHDSLKADIFHSQRRHADSVVQSVWQSKRIVIVTGAGISVAGGIPVSSRLTLYFGRRTQNAPKDFRSIDGLYNLVKSKYPHAVVKGRDLFDANLFKDPISTQVFYSFMGELKETVERAQLTKVHKFIHQLQQRKKLLRCYTQNIDCLEERLGLDCNLNNKKSPVIPLHGTLNFVVCTVCKQRSEYTEEHKQIFKQGTAPPCLSCTEKNELRLAQNRREIAVGTLRPDIILYNEHHSAGDLIAEYAAMDLGRRPDMLIVMGTSLKIPGIKKMVKDLAKEVRQQTEGGGGSLKRIGTLLVNKTELSGLAEWKNVFDASWVGDADEIVGFIEHGLREIESLAEDRRRRRLSLKKAKENLMVNQRLITDCLHIVKSGSSAKTVEQKNKGHDDKENVKQQQPIGEVAEKVVTKKKPASAESIKSVTAAKEKKKVKAAVVV